MSTRRKPRATIAKCAPEVTGEPDERKEVINEVKPEKKEDRIFNPQDEKFTDGELKILVKESGEGNELLITVFHDDVKYIGVVSNFITCQNKPFLTEEECSRIILNCNDTEYGIRKSFSLKQDMISIKFTIIKDRFIHFDCTRYIETEEESMKSKIVRLEKRIIQLEKMLFDDGYPNKHVHIYPKWSTLDEFKKLPDFKYFDIDMFHVIPEKTSIDGKTKYTGEIYGITYYINTGNPQPKYKNVWCIIHNSNNDVGTFGSFIVSKAYYNCKFGKYEIVPMMITEPEDRILEIEEKRIGDHISSIPHHLVNDYKYPLYYHFTKSVEVPVHKSRAISKWFIEYLARYVRGWMIDNYEKLIFKYIKCEVIFSSDVKIIISWSDEFIKEYYDFLSRGTWDRTTVYTNICNNPSPRITTNVLFTFQ